ncbi:sugar ABC transporter permease [Clostridium sp. AF19-22AC]|jgi:raffinose/stachyose/melibiose transport system permease protein|uniref:Carbohydrate ABC transporter membrane protein 1 (CUT1 family) n=1 Tax=Faecalicatena orotica TaxID=1544 RepID=A0A2Y9BLV9_9FIRM|nr:MULTISPECIES: sugar ABC transporter permease [Clostridia]PWJ21570.1 carbohydrate ABC transporter membrane protein 1 (CUT1 family) [Faecalicatena orotica]RHR26263.1 sugar ABC transporter permease [Clostridium sp. AF19-22AC]SSA58381.1 carbohydrate ABC transporter membrane protein 1, CUT1 family [Faecalicatena orotica]
MKQFDRRKLKGMVFVLPAFLIHVGIVLIPAVGMVWYSFTNWNGLKAPKFIGLQNYVTMLSDTSFFHALKNNLIWMAMFLVIPLAIGLILAVILSNISRGQMLLRTIYFLPYVVGAAIAGKIFATFYSPYSGIASVFKALGIESLSNFAPLGNGKLALYAVAFVDNWHWWGFVLVLMFSALHQVDRSLLEAATMEGAGPLRKFFSVTVPQIKPTIISYFTFILIASFTTFDYVWIMTQGGPSNATELVSTWIYRKSFISYEVGYGSALCTTVCGGCLAIYLLFTLVQKLRRRGEV